MQPMSYARHYLSAQIIRYAVRLKRQFTLISPQLYGALARVGAGAVLPNGPVLGCEVRPWLPTVLSIHRNGNTRMPKVFSCEINWAALIIQWSGGT
jgi:hypothetical protein